MKTKVCTNPDCVHGGEPQPVSNFRKASRHKDGLQYRCKDCKKVIDKRHYQSDTFKKTRERYQQTEGFREKDRAYHRRSYHRRKAKQLPALNYIYPALPPGTKVCTNSKCVHKGALQPLSNFHKNRTRKDGYNAYCKDCKRAWVKAYVSTERNKKAQRKYDQSEKGIAARKRYEQSETFKAAHRRYKKRHPNRIKARSFVNHAARDGKIPHISTQTCKECNRSADHYHHHKGYARKHWLDVVPLCRECHDEVG